MMLLQPSAAFAATPAVGRWLKYGGQVAVLTVVYVGTAKLSLALASINPSASPVWPPTGLALAAMLLGGYRLWPAILIGAFVANVTTAGSLVTSIAIGAGNTLECLIGAYCLDRWSHGTATFETPGGVGRFTAFCFVPAAMISATVGVASLSLGGYAEWAQFAPIWFTWWIGDVAGALLITPVIVLWAKSPPPSLRPEALARSIMPFALAAAIGLVAFSPMSRRIELSSPLAFLAIVPLMWTALRHDQRDTATTALILAGFAVWGAMLGSGPFARGNLNDSFLLLAAFMVSVLVPSLALSANVAMHDRHEQHIETVMLELSHRSKNLLAVVQSIARQVARRSTTFDDFDVAFSARIRALADVHDLLVARNWQGTPIREIIGTQLKPFGQPSVRIALDGPELVLRPKAVENLGLVLHELATNAAKYGALSVSTGSVAIRWSLNAASEPPQVRIEWRESGGPAVVVPNHKGFGHMVITHLAPRALDGEAELNYATTGLRWTLLVPAANVVEAKPPRRAGA